MLAQWLDYWHGAFEPHQYRYYRCEGCGGLVTHKRIKKGGCGCDRSNKLRPARLSFLEKCRCLFMPWSVAR